MRWFAISLLPVALIVQDRLQTMPGHQQYERMAREIPSAIKSGALSVTWTGNTTFEYMKGGKQYRFDVTARRSSELSGTAARNRRPPQDEEPERGRQFESALSPDGRMKAVYRSGKPFDDDVVGHYVYHVVWTPKGDELIFFRTNRRQNVMEVAAADPDTGACRVVVREAWPTGWVNEDPRMVFLEDGRRFIWES